MSVIEAERQGAEAEEKPNFLRYRDNAGEVLDALRLEGFVQTVEEVQAETDPNLRQQGEVIVHAKAARALDRLKTRMTERADINEAKVALIRYNHAVRDLIWDNPGAVFIDDLTEWLAEATGDQTWAEGIVAGAAGEVAVARALQDLGGIETVRFGGIEEDRRGADILAQINNGRPGGEWLAIDVKARQHLLQGDEFIRLPRDLHNGRYQCEVGVESRHINHNATLDERAHRSQLGQLQDYVHEISQRHKAEASR